MGVPGRIRAVTVGAPAEVVMEQISKKLMNWASILGDKARAQAERTAAMPFVYPHVALMPDAHLGKGATVGSVIPTLGAIMPAAVGVDIGCGMIALRTQFTGEDARARGDLAALREAIERAIPLSAGRYNGRIYGEQTTARMTELETREGADSAEHIALLNREEMMHRVADCASDWFCRAVESAETVNTHHNYTERETHFGKEVWLSRKGAIDASPGKPGLIPGSMGTRSYIVTGKGNRLALNSSPHGAGREYSRSAARKAFSRAQLEAAMAGIEWRRTDALLDEIPGAYKDIDVIMEDAKDLVEIRHVLRQIVNVKGN